MFVSWSTPMEPEIAFNPATPVTSTPQWHEATPAVEILGSMRAIMPLVAFLLAVLFLLLKEKISEPAIVGYGLILAPAGMVLFNIGLTYGLSMLGDQTGGFVALGIAKIIFGFAVGPVLVCGYALALGMTAISSEEFVNVAWDSAGVTTGPVTVRLVLALGLSFSGAVGAVAGFGILAGASLCPIVSVLGLGLYLESREKSRKVAEVRALALQKEIA